MAATTPAITSATSSISATYSTVPCPTCRARPRPPLCPPCRGSRRPPLASAVPAFRIPPFIEHLHVRFVDVLDGPGGRVTAPDPRVTIQPPLCDKRAPNHLSGDTIKE